MFWPGVDLANTPAAVVWETDDALRARLLYVTCYGLCVDYRVKNASGDELDSIAWEYGLMRRKVSK